MFIPGRKEKGTERKLGLFALVVLGLGSMIGSGIFVLLGPGVKIAGAALPFSFLIGGILALGIALIYAEFTAAIPTSGSSLTLIFEAYGVGPLSFIISWLIVLGDVAYAAINALGFAYYTNLLVPVKPVYLAVGVVLIILALNWKGIKRAVAAENLIALLLTLGLSLFALEAISKFELPNSLFTGLNGLALLPILAGSALVYTAFIGYEDLAAVAGEVRNPGKNMPRALIITVLLATVLFFGISFIAIHTVGVEELASSDAPLITVANLLGSRSRFFVFLTAILATLSSVITMILVGSRELYAVANQGFFENTFGELNESKVPGKALIFVTILTLFLVITNSAEFVAYLGNAVYLAGMVLIGGAIIKLKRKRPYLERPFKIPFFPLIPLVVMGGSILLLFFIGAEALFVSLVWVLTGFILYLLTWIKRERLFWMGLGSIILIALIAGILIYLTYWLPAG